MVRELANPLYLDMRKSFSYKVKLPPSAIRKADEILELHRWLYNRAIVWRRNAWQRGEKHVTLYDQINGLTELRRDRPEFAAMNREATESVLRRVDLAFQSFFRRVKNGEIPGYPRFKGPGRYRSVVFRRRGWRLAGRRLTLRGIGTARLFLSREIEGRIKTVTLKRDAVGDWFVVFSCDDVPVRPMPDTGKDVGIDLGLLSFLATSDGEHIDNPRHLRSREAAIKRAERIVSKRRRGGNRRKTAVRTLARRHRSVASARKDFHFKTALDLVRRYDTIAVEDLNIRGLARTRMAKSVHDAGWGNFIRALKSQAESAGREIVTVDARGTSQECSACGSVPEKRKTLSVRTHRCSCGLVMDRDENAARNILKRARAEPSGSGRRSQAAA